MLHKISEEGAWFAPKRYGYGAGLPIRREGWLLIGSYVAALAGIGLLDRAGPGGARTAAFVVFLLVTGLFAVIVARRTRGGWKWRWGEKE
jgi:membrane-associated PAP2 superfamily phosphatase